LPLEAFTNDISGYLNSPVSDGVAFLCADRMPGMRLYQISLRTILEVVFVAAVVLAFFYWRNVPRMPAGRYHVQMTDDGGLIYLDTATGEAWVSDRKNSKTRNWSHLNTPWGQK
jgi:hypothetical protein